MSFKFIPRIFETGADKNEEVCGTCKHHKMDIFADSWVCDNEDAGVYYLQETEYGDSCLDWEEKE